MVEDKTHCSYSTAYLRLRRRILHMEVPPGARLRISVLADDLRMSQTPVREALSRLAQEKIIETRQQRGFFVKNIDPAEVTELYALVHLNMSFLFRQAAARDMLPVLSNRIRALFEGPTVLCAARAFLQLCHDLDTHSQASNTTQALELLLLRTRFVQLVEYSNDGRRENLRRITADMANSAQRDRRSTCYRNLDRLFLVRSGWMDEVFRQTAIALEQIGQHSDTGAVTRL